MHVQTPILLFPERSVLNRTCRHSTRILTLTPALTSRSRSGTVTRQYGSAYAVLLVVGLSSALRHVCT
jgi:hypothetical protein